MPRTFIPLQSWTPDLGEHSPPNPGYVCVENIAPSASGYDRQYTFAPSSAGNPPIKPSNINIGYMASYSFPKFDATSGSELYDNREEWMFFGSGGDLYLSKNQGTPDNVANQSMVSEWSTGDYNEGADASFTRFGPFILASSLGCKVHIFDTRDWTAAGTEDFVPISLPSGVPTFKAALITSHKVNVFVADVIFSSSFEGYSGHVSDMLMWSDDYSAENFGSRELTPHLAGNGYILLRDNHGPIRAICSADEVLYVFKEDAIYRIDGPPYTPQKIISGIGTVYKNTVFAVGSSVYFFSQYGPARISGGQLEMLGRDGGWGRLICKHDSTVPVALPAHKYPFIEDNRGSFTRFNVPCGAYDPKTGNVLFGFYGRVRKMGTTESSGYAGYNLSTVWHRRGLLPLESTEEAALHSRCNVLLVVNEKTGAASVNYPMNLEAAVTGRNPNCYGFRCLVPRPTYNTVATSFKFTTAYEEVEDFQDYSWIGSMTADHSHVPSGSSFWVEHLAATEYNPICLTTPLLRCPEQEQGDTWVIHRVRPVFAHHSEFSFSYGTGSTDTTVGKLMVNLYVHRSSGTLKKYEWVAADGLAEDGWILVNGDVASTMKALEFEMYRTSAGFQTAPESPVVHVPWPGRFLGFEVDYSIRNKRAL